MTTQMNNDLLWPFTAKEVRVAIFQMGPHKAPGIDGFPTHFFQNYWEIMGNRGTCNILDLLNNNSHLLSLNTMWIDLIHKTNNPKDMSQFRPISLCNVLYKIIVEVLVN